jgi:hypothetical protein
MLKKIFIIGAVVALTGCATHQQSNELAGAAMGGVIGNAVGGRAGAVLGAGVGAMIGGQQPTQSQRPVYTERQPVYVERQVIRNCGHYIDRERSCYQLRYGDTRAMCIEDARTRYNSCMHNR